jgi:choline dehydrogenase
LAPSDGVVLFAPRSRSFPFFYLVLQPTLSTPHAIPLQSHADLKPAYDFVIVGGGASGLTVADRLSEDPFITVLVLEYGPFHAHEPSVLVPGLLNLTTTPYWFNLTSTPQPQLNNRTFQVTIAAAVRGGTVINGMLFHRGAKADYEAWEELGARGWGWGWSDLLPYFQKSEKFTPPNAYFAHEWEIEWHPRPTSDQLPALPVSHHQRYLQGISRAWCHDTGRS